MKLIKQAFTLLSAALIFISCTENNNEVFIRNEYFNNGWKFSFVDDEEAMNVDFDDSKWKSIDLPHDWSINDYPTQDSMHTGPFKKDLPGGKDVGYLRDGTAWYRKHFTTPKKTEGKQFFLNFDGIQTQSEVWINGKMATENKYGYSPFNVNITTLLNPIGETNVIAVKSSNTGKNSRWFAGAGIYRPVRISIVNEISIDPWGVSITTPDVSTDSALVSFAVSTHNYSEETTSAAIKIKIIDPLGNEFFPKGTNSSIEPGSSVIMQSSQTIRSPHLWDTEKPDLYTAIVNVFVDEEHVDTYASKFGIRSIKYNAETGFLLNGKEVFLKGGCMHHDNGLLGSTAFPEAEFRRVKIMKDNGYNAIRTSHNPPSEYFLNACDRFGILVIDEAFDHWVKAKREKDYSNYFEEWHRKDIQSMVYRDRNHPSVIMWSIGNEIQERADPEGIVTGKKLKEAVREIDNSRPITQAICSFWDNPGKTWDDTEGAFEFLDIGGYNYQYKQFERDHSRYPERIMYASESFPNMAWENWDKVKKHKYVIGDFVWTAMDYIGESGIGHTTTHKKSETIEYEFLQPWPWYISWCGDIDICGEKKPQSYYRDVVWGNSKLEIMVQSPREKNEIEHVSMWGWPDELPTWGWDIEEDQLLTVRVFSSYPEVKLELNGETIGKARISIDDKYIATFKVPYHRGELKATGIVNGKEQESRTLQSLGSESTTLFLEAENEMFLSGRNHIYYFRVANKDKNGTLDYAAVKVSVKLEGEAELLAAGNAAPEHEGSFTDNEFSLFRGRGLIILRSTGSPGPIRITIESESGETASLYLESI